MLTIEIVDALGGTRLVQSGPSPLSVHRVDPYLPGDEVIVRSDASNWLTVRIGGLAEAQVYVPSKEMRYRIPFGAEADAYPPGCFTGENHAIEASETPSGDALRRRNLALNPLDQRREAGVFPHATANVETRNEAGFAARNAIDGMLANDGHGAWPYQSWGIGARTDAHLTVWFGREVVADAMTLYLRADFPHDAYWVRASVEMSDGYKTTFPLRRTGEAQLINFPPRKVEWIRLHQLIKSDDPSAFPALTEWEIYGSDI